MQIIRGAIACAITRATRDHVAQWRYVMPYALPTANANAGLRWGP